VVRRLSLDRLRHLYGRNPGESGVPDPDRQNRRRLVDLVGESIQIERLQDASGNPETELRRRQLEAALASALESVDFRDLLLLKLRFEDDLPAREVATLLGFPTVFHVYRRQNAVLESLRGALRARGFEGAQP
jgi:RNA polymerase sigma factor (sigma-70 family)